MKQFYDALNEVYGPTSSGPSRILSADRNSLITDKTKTVERWAEHFSSVLNRSSAINDEAINRLHQVTNEALDDSPTLPETKKAIHLLSGGKASGSDSIPAEVYKEGGTALTKKLHQLFILMWQQETILQDFKDASIIHLYKRKGNRPVKTTEAFHSSSQQARYSPRFCLTVSHCTSTRDSFQRACVDYGKSAEP